MGNCGNKISHMCGSINYATCTRFEGSVNEKSNLVDTTCLSIEETTQDIYSQLNDIYSAIDVSDIEGGCVTLSNSETVTSIIQKLYNEVCILKSTIESQQELITTLQGQIEDIQENPCA